MQQTKADLEREIDTLRLALGAEAARARHLEDIHAAMTAHAEALQTQLLADESAADVMADRWRRVRAAVVTLHDRAVKEADLHQYEYLQPPDRYRGQAEAYYKVLTLLDEEVSA